jgi:hypothetical protein
VLGNAEVNAERKCSEWKLVNDSLCPCELQQVKGQTYSATNSPPQKWRYYCHDACSVHVRKVGGSCQKKCFRVLTIILKSKPKQFICIIYFYFGSQNTVFYKNYNVIRMTYKSFIAQLFYAFKLWIPSALFLESLDLSVISLFLWHSCRRLTCPLPFSYLQHSFSVDIRNLYNYYALCVIIFWNLRYTYNI